MTTRVDLHCHSSASDGRLTPAEVVRLAVSRGIEVLALTDHDTTAGVVEAAAAAPPGFTLIPGLEINSEGDETIGGIDVDFLGYFVDPAQPALQEQLLLIRDARLGRARGMVNKLAALGMPLRWERVLEIAGDAESIARPHVARALLEAGYVSSVKEAFDLYLHDGGPAYVSRMRLTALQAIDAVHAAGGVAILAHPHHNHTAHLIPTLAAQGIDGIEVYYSDHTPEQREDLLRTAREYNLLVTGGSDFHSWGDGIHANLGEVEVPWETFEQLRDRAGKGRL